MIAGGFQFLDAPRSIPPGAMLDAWSSVNLNDHDLFSETSKSPSTAFPEKAHDHVARGEEFSERGLYEKALKEFDSALKVSKNFARAHACRSFALEKLGRLKTALAAVNRAIKIDPKFAGAHAFRGFILGRLERPSEVLLDAFDEALRRDPGHVFGHVKRGGQLSLLGRHGEALEDFNYIIDLKTEIAKVHHAEAYQLRGYTRFNLGDWGGALVDYDRAIELEYNDSATAHHGRALSLWKLERRDEALKAYERALELDPDNVEYLRQRTGLYSQLDRFKEALVDIDEAIRLDPNDITTHSYRCAALAFLERSEDALAACEYVLGLKPDDERALVARAVSLQELRRFEDALDTIERLIQIKGEKADLYSWRDATRRSIELEARKRELEAERLNLEAKYPIDSKDLILAETTAINAERAVEDLATKTFEILEKPSEVVDNALKPDMAGRQAVAPLTDNAAALAALRPALETWGVAEKEFRTTAVVLERVAKACSDPEVVAIITRVLDEIEDTEPKATTYAGRSEFASALEAMTLKQRREALDQHYSGRKVEDAWAFVRSDKPTPEEMLAWLDKVFPDRREIGMMLSDLEHLDEHAHKKIKNWSLKGSGVDEAKIQSFGLPPKKTKYDPERDADAPKSMAEVFARAERGEDSVKNLNRAFRRASYHRDI